MTQARTLGELKKSGVKTVNVKEEMRRNLMRKLELKDLWPLPVYEGVRHQFRREVIAAKHSRRVTVGPFMTFVFENRLTVKFQIQEILRAERMTDEAQVRLERENGHHFIAEVVEAFPGEIQAISVSKPALEDIFIHRTGHKFWTEGHEKSY